MPCALSLLSHKIAFFLKIEQIIRILTCFEGARFIRKNTSAQTGRNRRRAPPFFSCLLATEAHARNAPPPWLRGGRRWGVGEDMSVACEGLPAVCRSPRIPGVYGLSQSQPTHEGGVEV